MCDHDARAPGDATARLRKWPSVQERAWNSRRSSSTSCARPAQSATAMWTASAATFYPIWVPGIMEGILANREQCDKYPVLGESFEAYTRRRPEMLAPMLDSGKTGMFFMRVMPVMSAIENDSHAASYDEVRTLIENATAISVGPCSCPPCPPSHGRGLRPPRRGHVHVHKRQRQVLLRAGQPPPRQQGRGARRSSSAPRTTASCTR